MVYINMLQIHTLLKLYKSMDERILHMKFLRQILKVPDDKILRIVFNEITPKAVKHSVENPRGIDMDMVKAQQTRQILDKLVGYKLSPVLWKQIGNRKLSAGRVQSVALRMICEKMCIRDRLMHLRSINLPFFQLHHMQIRCLRLKFELYRRR